MPKKTPKVPKGLRGGRDGLLDPDRLTTQQRITHDPARLDEEHARRTSPSPVVRRLQAATDRALGKA